MEKVVSDEVKLFEDMVKFMENIYISNEQVTMDDRKVLSVAHDNVNAVHRELSAVILSSSSIDVSSVIKDYSSKVEKELNDICNKVSNLTIKADIKDYVDSFQHDDAVVDNDAAADPFIAYIEKRKKLILESEDYKQTLEFIHKLKVIARNEQVPEKDINILLRGHKMIMRLYRALYKTIDSDHSSSFWHNDMSLTISESRTKVENELNYICSNMTDHTIKEDISQHLAAFKAGHLPKKLFPLLFADRKRESNQSEMRTTKKKSKLGSGDDEFRTDFDCCCGYPNYGNPIKNEVDPCFSQMMAIFGDWNSEPVGKEIDIELAVYDSLKVKESLLSA